MCRFFLDELDGLRIEYQHQHRLGNRQQPAQPAGTHLHAQASQDIQDESEKEAGDEQQDPFEPGHRFNRHIETDKI